MIACVSTLGSEIITATHNPSYDPDISLDKVIFPDTLQTIFLRQFWNIFPGLLIAYICIKTFPNVHISFS